PDAPWLHNSSTAYVIYLRAPGVVVRSSTSASRSRDGAGSVSSSSHLTLPLNYSAWRPVSVQRLAQTRGGRQVVTSRGVRQGSQRRETCEQTREGAPGRGMQHHVGAAVELRRLEIKDEQWRAALQREQRQSRRWHHAQRGADDQEEVTGARQRQGGIERG